MSPPCRVSPFRRLAGGVACAALAFALPVLWPDFELRILVRGAAWLASIFSGSPLAPCADGWALAPGGEPVRVTAACSAGDFFHLSSALVGWHMAGLSPTGRRWAVLVPAVVAATLAVTSVINALRVVALAHVHRLVVPAAPPAWEGVLHLGTGIAIFLPTLIALHLVFERHGNASASQDPADCR